MVGILVKDLREARGSQETARILHLHRVQSKAPKRQLKKLWINKRNGYNVYNYCTHYIFHMANTYDYRDQGHNLFEQ